MRTEIPLDSVKCDPPGSMDTAIDVEVDRDGAPRRCGMCGRDVAGSKLGQNCPHCKHRFGWFQLLGESEALGDNVRSEKALAAFIKRRRDKMKRLYGSAIDFDGPDGE
jgi:hypothetical protein